MSGKKPRGRSAYRGAMAEWRRKKQAEGKWEEAPQRCLMVNDGIRCRGRAAGAFGYCESCWNAQA